MLSDLADDYVRRWIEAHDKESLVSMKIEDVYELYLKETKDITTCIGDFHCAFVRWTYE